MRLEAILPSHLTLDSYLFEANVFNIKDEYNGVSIANYLKQFTNNLPGLPLQQMFVKKISALLVNDERFHYAVRQLPAEAPEWAQKAVAAQQLVAFKPTEELNDMIAHITHYLAAAAEDAAKSPSPDQKVVAQRELAAFPKAENLEIIKKNSDVFFQRGSRKAGREVSGMEQVLDAGGGFIWHKLVDEGAFKREGKVLQNCIGSHWTKAKTDNEGMIICVLKTPDGDSAVAMRLKDKTRELYELKGKNNLPPIQLYMPPCLKFINKMKLIPQHSAMHDLKRTGYFYDETHGDVIPRTEAIKRLVKQTNIATINDQYILTKATSDNADLFTDLYSNLISHAYRYYSSRSKAELVIYELRNKSNTPLAGANVEKGTLERVLKYPQVASEVSEAAAPKQDPIIVVLVQALIDNKLVTNVSGEVQELLTWHERSQLSSNKKQVIPIKSDQDDYTTGEHHLKWNVFTDENTIKSLLAPIKYKHSYHEVERDELNVKQIKKLYVETGLNTKEVDTQPVHIIIQTKGGNLIPFRAIFSDGKITFKSSDVGFDAPNAYSRGPRNEKVINTLISFANSQKLELPKSVQMNHGVVHSKEGYTLYKPKFEQLNGSLPAVKLDLEGLSPSDKISVIAFISTNRKYVDIGTNDRDIFSVLKGIGFHRTGKEQYSYEFKDTDKWSNGQIEEIYDKLFAGKPPTAMYSVDVTYGADQKARVTMMASGKDIIRVDEKTAGSSWQKWEDLDTIAQQLNKFAAEQHLQFHADSLVPFKQTKKASHLGELRVDNGKIITAEHLKRQEIERKRVSGKYQSEGTDELKFANGCKFERMTPEAQALWSRTEAKGVGGNGEAWKFFNNQGEAIAIVVVSSSKKILGMYGKNRYVAKGTTPRINERGVISAVLPFLKKASETFGWSERDSSALLLKPDSRVQNALERYSTISSLRYNLRPEEILLINLRALQLTRGVMAANTGSKRIEITQAGRDLLRKLQNGEQVPILNFVSAAELPADFVAPQKRTVEKPASTSTSKWATSTNAPRTGTKADQALAKFREMAATGTLPSRSEFIRVLQQAPFNMSAAGAQTYYYTTKAKYAALGESLSVLAGTQLKNDILLKSFRRFLVDPL